MNEINTGGSSAVKSSRPANFYQNARVPPVVVESVASFISDTMMGHFFEELATRNPRHRSVLPNSHRTDLLSMCLVHRTWTPIMQRILRRRVRIHSPLRLKGFLESPACGPWVVELWYTYDNVSSDLMDLSLFVAGEKRSHWQLLAKLLSRLPNLRFLSVELNDYPEPSCDSEEKEEEQDNNSEGDDGSVSEKEAIRKAQPLKKGGLELGEAEALVEEMKYILEHGEDPFDGTCRQERFDCRGIRDALNAIGRLSNLEGLVLLCDAVRAGSLRFTPMCRLSRYFPYFIQACQQLPNLTRLKCLYIRGWSGWYDVEEDDDLEDPIIRVDKELLSECLINKSPPASLKTLILEVPDRRAPSKHLRWLQVPQGDYALKNLFVRFDDICDIDHAIKWMASLGEIEQENLATIPSLENVRVEFPYPCQQIEGMDGLDEERLMRKEVSNLLTKRLTGIRTLHAAPFFLDAPLPSTLEDLRIVFDSKPPDGTANMLFDEESDHDLVWNARGRTLTTLLNDMTFEGPPRKIFVTVTDAEDDLGDKVCDWEDMETLLASAFDDCRDKGIEVYTTKEMDLQERIRDFLLFGRVQYPDPERKVTEDMKAE